MHSEDLLRQPHVFIVNDLVTTFFASCPMINILSTYNRRMRKSPPSYLFTKTQWSACVLWNACSVMKDSNFYYHCQGACFKPYKLLLSRHTRFSLPFSMNPSRCCMQISSSRSPCRNILSKSNCSTSRAMLVAMLSTVRMYVIFTTGENISTKFTPFYY